MANGSNTDQHIQDSKVLMIVLKLVQLILFYGQCSIARRK